MRPDSASVPTHEGRRIGVRIGLLPIAFVAFIGLGLPDGLTGVAWPSIRDSFGLDQSGLGLLLLASAAGYLTSSALAGTLLRRVGVGRLLTLSKAAVVLALCGWVVAPSWAVVLICAPVLGAGGGAIDAALNFFVATRFGPRQLNWLHACYGLGAMLGPLIVTTALTVAGASWRTGIAAVALCLVPLVLLYAATRRIWDTAPPEAAPQRSPGADTASRTMAEAVRHGGVWLQVAAFFVLTGIETTAGQWSFSVMTEQRGIGTAAAGIWVGAFWGAFTAGRVVSGIVVTRIGSVRLTRLAAIVAGCGALLFAADPGPWIAGAGLVLIGVGIAPLFPGLMAETPRRLGLETARHAIGFQVSGAVLGGATVPALAGLLADRFGLAMVPLVLVTVAGLFLCANEILHARLDDRRVAAALP